jgi:hypothetical protein
LKHKKVEVDDPVEEVFRTLRNQNQNKNKIKDYSKQFRKKHKLKFKNLTTNTQFSVS